MFNLDVSGEQYIAIITPYNIVFITLFVINKISNKYNKNNYLTVFNDCIETSGLPWLRKICAFSQYNRSTNLRWSIPNKFSWTETNTSWPIDSAEILSSDLKTKYILLTNKQTIHSVSLYGISAKIVYLILTFLPLTLMPYLQIMYVHKNLLNRGERSDIYLTHVEINILIVSEMLSTNQGMLMQELTKQWSLNYRNWFAT